VPRSRDNGSRDTPSTTDRLTDVRDDVVVLVSERTSEVVGSITQTSKVTNTGSDGTQVVQETQSEPRK
jgi:hypothetical protein